MPSNKKKRGKQRKVKQSERQAASVPADSADVVAEINDGFASVWADEERYRRSFKSLSAEKVVRDIMMGHVTATNMIMMLSKTDASDVQFIEKLRGAGLVKVVLDLLKKCNTEAPITSVMPSEWMHILYKADSSECHAQIAEGMGPIIKCLSNDSERKFFGHNQHWIYTYPYYLGMVKTLVQDKASREETTTILMTHEGFVESIIHPMFWKSHRPDICKELVAHLASGHVFSTVVDIGFDIICWIGSVVQNLESIATTPIVSKTYNPECDVVFVEGFIRAILQAHSSEAWIKNSEECKRRAFCLLNIFVGQGCVDRGVIKAAVDYGKDTATSYNDAVHITNLLGLILVPKTKIEQPDSNGNMVTGDERVPIDNRYSAAVGAGLLQVCLNLLTKFRGRADDDLTKCVNFIVGGASKVVFQKRTSSAILAQQAFIRGALGLLEQTHSSVGASNEYLHAIVEIAKLLVNIKGEVCRVVTHGRMSACHHCGKWLEKGDIKKCAACKMMVYCSRACQLQSWEGGHKTQCKHLSKSRSFSKKNDNETIISTGWDIVQKNIQNIILQASILHLDCVNDCVVIIDFTEGTPSIYIEPTFETLARFQVPGVGGELAGAKETIDTARASGAMTCCFMTFGSNRFEACLLLHSIFPSNVNIRATSWRDLQNVSSKTEEWTEIIDKCRHDSNYREMKLEDLRWNTKIGD